MTLPILLSVPHAGLCVPPEAEPYCQLSSEQIVKDGDEGAAEIYDLRDEVAEFITTDIARAIVDVNRAEDDRRPDGVVKTHTCWNEPVYAEFPPAEVIEKLLALYYRPYHKQFSSMSNDRASILCVDCHTMAEFGPPIGPDSGKERPWVCLGDGNGATLPKGWMETIANAFRHSFGKNVTINDPFSGGFITRSHGSHDTPWLQLEISRSGFLTNYEKRQRVIQALNSFCDRMLA